MYTEHDDTIAAIATPSGRSALGIIRISGKECRKLVPEVFIPSHRKEIIPARPILGRILLSDTRYIDEAVLTQFVKPHSYTREDLAEISCHGNPMILEQILEKLLESGARLAVPGEFTFRAFLNGRLDLVQAEAVQDLISANSLTQVELALQQMDGRLSMRFRDLRKGFIELISLMEGNIDFSEEQHYEFIDSQEIVRRHDELLTKLQELLGTFERGRIIREGFQVVITGRPNVGKSSLFNFLLGEDRAIVTPTAGTTRDYIREPLRLNGHLVQLSDTAGIRESREEIEILGIERSREMIDHADLVLLLVDGSEDLKPEDHELWNIVKDKDVIVINNKLDKSTFQKHTIGAVEPASVSALKGEGLSDLLKRITNRVEERTKHSSHDALVSNIRHRNLLRKAGDALARSREAAAAGLSEEFILIDLNDAMSSVGEITGEVTIEDIYQHIFANFCIGK